MEPSHLYEQSDPPAPPRHSWLRTAVGAMLVLLGLEIILERATDREFHLVVPALGLVLLAAWFRHDRFPFLVAGSLFLGAGLGILLESAFGSSFGFAVSAGFAWGFWLIQQLSGKRIGWARVGMLIALTLAAVELVVVLGVGDALSSLSGGAAAPLAAITAGLLLLFRRRLSPPVFVVGLVVTASLALTAVGGAIAGTTDGIVSRRTVDVELPSSLEGGTLVIESGSGDIDVTAGSRLSVKATIRGHHDRPAVVEQDDEVLVRTDRDGWALFGGVSYAVVLPPSTGLRVTAGSADVDLSVGAGSRVEVTTGSGDVDLSILGDPDIEVRTGSGELDAEGFGNEDIETEGGWSYDGEGRGEIMIRTGSGDVEIEKEEQ